jgi:hypothetical protein
MLNFGKGSSSLERILSFLSVILCMCCVMFIDLCMNHTHVVYDLFIVLLNSVCKYFVENLYMYVHQGN